MPNKILNTQNFFTWEAPGFWPISQLCYSYLTWFYVDRPSFTIMALPRGPIWIIENTIVKTLDLLSNTPMVQFLINGLFTPVFYFEKVVPEWFDN